MVWRDLRRRPIDTITLIALVAVSVLLATVSAGLLATVGGAADRLLDEADSPHVVQMHAGELDESAIAAWTDSREDVVASQLVPLLTLDGDGLALAGRSQTDSIQQNSLMVPQPERDLLLTLDGTPLTRVDRGEVWLPVYYAIEAGLAAGDPVTITAPDGFTAELVVAGFHRDPIMNTAIASSKRLAVNAADLDEIGRHTGSVEYLVEFWLTDPSEAGSFAAAYLEAGLPSLGPSVDRTTFRLLTMIGEGLDAGLVILASLLLLLIGLLCLRLSLLTAVQQDLREIGVLKAIGVPVRTVRRMQLTKYAGIGAAACVLGLAAGLAVLPLMSRSLTAYMGPVAGIATWAAPVVTAAAIFALVVVFVALLLRRINRISAVEAMRSATPGGRRPRLRLSRRQIGPIAVHLGLDGMLRRLPTTALLGTVLAVATFIVVVPLSVAMTIASSSFTGYMGIPPVDLRADLPAGRGEPDLAALSRALDADPVVDAFTVHTAVRAEVDDTDGLPLSVLVENGDHETLPLSYAEGRAPRAADEIALSLVAMAQTGRTVGEAIEVRSGGVATPVEIVGAYQDVTNGGRTARGMLRVDDADVVWHVVGVDLVHGADAAAEAERLGAALPDARISTVDAYRAQTLGPVAERSGATALLGAVVAATLAALITVMTTRLVLASDAGQIAIQRALGIPDRTVRRQYLTQALLTLVIAVPVGVLAAATIGQGMFNLLFEGLYSGFEQIGQGTSRIEFIAAPLVTFVALPIAFAIVVGAATLAACRGITTMGIRTVVPE